MTPFMTQEEERQRYYEYVPDNGEWWIKTPPPREPWFEAGLAEIGGHHPNGKVILRVIWAGTEMHDYTHRPQLKYQAVRRIIKGYKYWKKDGTLGYVRKGHRMTDEEIAQMKDRLEMVPVRADHAFGRLRWIIERYCPPEKLRELHRFEHPFAPDGTRILREFPREGVYDCFFVVQRRNNGYRDLDQQVLTAVEAMYRYNLRAEEAQAGLDSIDEHNMETILAKAEARRVFIH
jgi:hypothetical protein